MNFLKGNYVSLFLPNFFSLGKVGMLRLDVLFLNLHEFKEILKLFAMCTNPTQQP